MPDGSQHHPTYRAEDVRQGTIVLKKPWQRAIFIAGLGAGFFVIIAIAVLVRLGLL